MEPRKEEREASSGCLQTGPQAAGSRSRPGPHGPSPSSSAAAAAGRPRLLASRACSFHLAGVRGRRACLCGSRVCTGTTFCPFPPWAPRVLLFSKGRLFIGRTHFSHRFYILDCGFCSFIHANVVIQNLGGISLLSNSLF